MTEERFFIVFYIKNTTYNIIQGVKPVTTFGGGYINNDAVVSELISSSKESVVLTNIIELSGKDYNEFIK